MTGDTVTLGATGIYGTAPRNERMPKLGQLLVQHGWASPRDVDRALQAQSAAGGRLGTSLLENNAISEDLLLKALSEQHRVPAVGVEDLRDIPPETIEVLPAKLAVRCKAIPFKLFSTQVHVAMVDPRDLNCLDELAFALGKRVQPFVATEVRLAQALDRYYGDECPSRLATLVERLDRARYLWREEEVRRAASGAGGSSRGLWEHPEAALFPDEPSTPFRGAPPAGLASGARAAAGAAVEAPEAPAAPPPPARLRPKPRRRELTVTLTEEERRELAAYHEATGGPEPEDRNDDTRPVPVGAPPVPLSAAGLEALLEAATSTEEVATALLAFLGQRFERVALFKVLRDRVVGWHGAGAGVDAECLAGFSADFSQPSTFLNLRQSGSFYLGPLPPMAVHKTLSRCWGGALPPECLLLPVRIRGRLVTVIFVDRGAESLGKVDLEALLHLAHVTADAYERCILRKKKD